MSDWDWDWDKKTVWMIAHATEGPMLDTVATSEVSCRECFVAGMPRSWAEFQADGFRVVAYGPATPPQLRISDQVVSDESYWRYPAAGQPAPRGVGLALLTVGKVQVHGEWRDDGGYIAWAPKIRRNKQVEAQYGLL